MRTLTSTPGGPPTSCALRRALAVLPRPRRPHPNTLRVVALTGGLTAVSALLAVLLQRGGVTPYSGLVVPWWLLAAGFLLTESAVLHVQVKREAQTVSISELPLVIGLFFAGPWGLLAGRLVGSLIVYVGLRRSPWLKTTFNTALVTTETLVALAVFHVVAGAAGPLGPRQWAAALAATLVANAVASVALGLVIGVYEGATSLRTLATEAVTGQVMTPAVVVLALVAVDCLASDRVNAGLVAAAAAVLTAAYRQHAALFDRHVNLERLYGFTQEVSRAQDPGSVLRGILAETRVLLKAERAWLVMGPSDDRTGWLRLGLEGDAEAEEATTGAPMPTDWVAQAVLGEGRSLVLPRRSRERRVRMWLGARDLRDAVAVPLHGAGRVAGMLVVGERRGEVRTFEQSDVTLLETLATHASVALEREQLIDRLQHDALHDALTGLPNRMHFQRRLTHALQSRPATGDRPAVLILDLDGFKDVNDTLGHHEGDRVLVEVASRLREAVGRDGFVARLGGDEFAVLVPAPAGRGAVRDVCRRIVEALQVPVRSEGMQFEVGASVGVALCPEHGDEGSVLMKRADMAMYDAKSSGLRISEYAPANDTASVRRLALVSELRSALVDGGVEVHVQPQVDLRSGRVGSVEALARWHHPELGWISPGEFVAVAERAGLIGPLTAVVLDASLQAAAGWLDLGVSVSVNVSPRSLLDPAFVDTVRAAVERWRVPAGSLTLEVTEGAVMTDPARSVAVLARFEEMGVRLSVDDFGTGYSSLAYLARLPVHEVKIDRGFVTELATSEHDQAIVRSIITLGRSLGLDTVAEGVEDQATYDLLTAMGCTKVQGWHTGRPMPPAALAAWLRAAVEGAQPALVA